MQVFNNILCNRAVVISTPTCIPREPWTYLKSESNRPIDLTMHYRQLRAKKLLAHKVAQQDQTIKIYSMNYNRNVKTT